MVMTLAQRDTCPICSGRGQITAGTACPPCEGTGACTAEDAERYRAVLTAAAVDGASQRFREAGRGAASGWLAQLQQARADAEETRARAGEVLGALAAVKQTAQALKETVQAARAAGDPVVGEVLRSLPLTPPGHPVQPIPGATRDPVMIVDSIYVRELDVWGVLNASGSGGFLVNPMTTLGDLIEAGASGVPQRLAVGGNGQVLTVVGGVPAWANSAAGFANPMTTANDMIIGGASGVAVRLPIGVTGQVLTIAAGTPSWQNAPSGFANPMTTKGDLIIANLGGAAGRLAIGAAGQVLTVAGGVPVWQTSPAGFINPMTTAGDLITGSAGGAAVRLAIGAAGQVLTMVGGLPAWQNSPAGFANPMTTPQDLIVGGAGGAATRQAAGAAGQLLTMAVPAGGGAASLGWSAGSVVDVVAQYGADPTGTLDSTAAINQALSDLSANVYNYPPTSTNIVFGGTAYLRPGIYKTTGPILMQQGVLLKGPIPATAAANSKPTPDWSGAIIFPASSWASALPNPAAVYAAGPAASPALSNFGIQDLWIDGSQLSGTQGGITWYGQCFHSKILGVGVFNVPGAGFTATVNGSGRTDGLTMRDCMIQTYGTYGVFFHGQDTQFYNVHVQNEQSGTITDLGCWWIDNGNNCMWSQCRGDQGVYGWVFDSNPGGPTASNTPGSTMRMISCGTENNAHNSLWLNNTNDPQMRTPVACVGCSFDYGGNDGTSAAVRVTGTNILTMQGCNVTCSGPSGSFNPSVGLKTEVGSGGGIPMLIDIDGGFWNVCTQTGSPPENPGTMVNDAANMHLTAGVILRYRFYGSAATNVIGGASPTPLASFISGTWP